MSSKSGRHNSRKQNKMYQLPVWILIAFIRLLVTLVPHSLLLSLGRGIGLLMYRFSSKMNKTARINIGLCYPDLSAEEQKALKAT